MKQKKHLHVPSDLMCMKHYTEWGPHGERWHWLPPISSQDNLYSRHNLMQSNEQDLHNNVLQAWPLTIL